MALLNACVPLQRKCTRHLRARARLVRAIGSYFLYEPHTFTFVATDTNYIMTDRMTNISSNKCCADDNNSVMIFKGNRAGFVYNTTTTIITIIIIALKQRT
jgi:hypothetical protein